MLCSTSTLPLAPYAPSPLLFLAIIARPNSVNSLEVRSRVVLVALGRLSRSASDTRCGIRRGREGSVDGVEGLRE